MVDRESHGATFAEGTVCFNSLQIEALKAFKVICNTEDEQKSLHILKQAKWDLNTAVNWYFSRSFASPPKERKVFSSTSSLQYPEKILPSPPTSSHAFDFNDSNKAQSSGSLYPGKIASTSLSSSTQLRQLIINIDDELDDYFNQSAISERPCAGSDARVSAKRPLEKDEGTHIVAENPTGCASKKQYDTSFVGLETSSQDGGRNVTTSATLDSRSHRMAHGSPAYNNSDSIRYPYAPSSSSSTEIYLGCLDTQATSVVTWMLHLHSEEQIWVKYDSRSFKKQGKRPSAHSSATSKGAVIASAPTTSAIANSSFASQNPSELILQSARGGVSMRISLKDREIGRCSRSISALLSPLYFAEIINVYAKISSNTPSILKFGDDICVRLGIFIKLTAFHKTYSGEEHQSVIQWSLMNLFPRIGLIPVQKALFWETQMTPLMNTSIPAKAELAITVRNTANSFCNSEDTFEEDIEETEESRRNTNAILGNEQDGCHAAGSLTTNEKERKKRFPAKSIFRTEVRQYQAEALWWMYSRENPMVNSVAHNEETASDVVADTTLLSKQRALHPMWEEYRFPVLCNESFKAPESVDTASNLDREDSKLQNASERYPHAYSTKQPDDAMERPHYFYFNKAIGKLSLRFPEVAPDCRGGILADDMGLGKTVEILSLISTDFESCKGMVSQSSASKRSQCIFGFVSNDHTVSGKTSVTGANQLPLKRTLELLPRALKGGTLLILPLSLMSQWECEIEKHLQPQRWRYGYYYGTNRSKDAKDLLVYDIVLTTYQTVSTEFNPECLDEDGLVKYSKVKDYSPLWLIHWHRIVLDEAHCIKNRNTRQCKAVCSLNAERRWCLTGTPIQNSIEDVYALIRFLRVEPWNHWSWWSKLVMESWNKGNTKAAIQACRRIVSPLMLRRTKDSKDENGELILRLPPKYTHTYTLSMSREEQAFYDAVFTRTKTKFDSLLQTGNVLKNYTHILILLLRLRQACCHPLLLYARCGTKILENMEELDGLMVKYIRSGRSKGFPVSEDFIRAQIHALKEGELQECPICLETALDPVMGQCCHILCRECAYTLLRQSNALCPTCRTKLNEKNLRALPGVRKLPNVLKTLTGGGGMNRVNMVDFGNGTTTAPPSLDSYDFMYSSKLAALKEFLCKDFESGRNAVVFSQWTSFFDIIEEMLKSCTLPYKRLDGSLSLENRNKILKWFSSPEDSSPLASGLEAEGIERMTFPLEHTHFTAAMQTTEPEWDASATYGGAATPSCEHFYQTKDTSISERIGFVSSLTSDAEDTSDAFCDRSPITSSTFSEMHCSVENAAKSKLPVDGSVVPTACVEKNERMNPSLSSDRLTAQSDTEDANLMVQKQESLPADLSGYCCIVGSDERRKVYAQPERSMQAPLVNCSSLKDNSKKSGKVLLCSLKAGGVGLNLTAASRVYIMDLWWNPAMEEQASQRVHRIGQENEVHIYRFVMKHSVEERILQIHKSKELTANSVISEQIVQEKIELNKLRLEDLKFMFKEWDSRDDSFQDNVVVTTV